MSGTRTCYWFSVRTELSFNPATHSRSARKDGASAHPMTAGVVDIRRRRRDKDNSADERVRKPRGRVGTDDPRMTELGGARG